MVKVKNIQIRLGIEDIVVPANKGKLYVKVYDENGVEVTDPDTYLVGYEDEDGNECEEDGTYFDERYAATKTLSKIRKNWTKQDFIEAYADEWDEIPEGLEACFIEMEDYIYNTYNMAYIEECIESEK